MRQLVVLALAPIIALGLALSAGTIVPDTPATTKVKPKSLVWGSRVFTTPGQLAHWLTARDASYGRWVARHPGASWFHKAPVPARRAIASGPLAKASKPKPLVTGTGGGSKNEGNDSTFALYGAVGLGALLLAGALVRLTPARRGRPRARASQHAPARLATTPSPAHSLAPARIAALSQPTHADAVYAMPRAYPEPTPRMAEPARVIPLYMPPEGGVAEVEPDPQPEPPIEAIPGLAPAANGSVHTAAPLAELAQLEGVDEEGIPHASVLPALAPPGSEWDACEIALWQGYVKSQFYARVMTPESHEYAVALSRVFRAKTPFDGDEVARSAHVNLALELLEKGWRPDGHGDQWWSLRFRMGDD